METKIECRLLTAHRLAGCAVDVARARATGGAVHEALAVLVEVPGVAPHQLAVLGRPLTGDGQGEDERADHEQSQLRSCHRR